MKVFASVEGAIVDMHWKDGKVTMLHLHATRDGAFQLTPPPGQSIDSIATSDGGNVSLISDRVFCTTSGVSYYISFL